MITKPRILFTCGREPEYVRNLLIRRALRQQFDMLEVTDSCSGSLLLRNVKLLPRLLKALREQYDLVFIGFYGYLLTLFLRQLTHKPIVFDAFVSNWDTLCFDRKCFKSSSIRGQLAYWLDKHSCLAANHCLLDTETHKHYFVDTFALPESKVSAFYMGYDPALFYPRPAMCNNDRFLVLYYGSFVPLQGVEHIVHAAKLLEAERDIEFRIIGEGITHPRMLLLARELQVRHLSFHPPVPYPQLPDAIARASICLGGPFGSTAKASRVIAGKTFQCLAMAKPTIVGDSPANHELFTNGEEVLMCKMADARALACAILQLKQDAELRAHIAQRGYEYCINNFSMEKQGQRLKQIISTVL